MKFKEQGFSIIQVLIALATVAGIGYYILGQQNIQSRQHSKNDHLQAFESASQIIKTALANVDVCTHNFRNRGIGYEPLSLATPSGSIIASKNQTYAHLNNIRIKSMKLISWKDTTTNEIADYLNVIYELDPMNKKKLIGGKTVSKKFRLRGKKAGFNYTSCYHEESNFVEASAIKNCQEMNGNWNNWNCNIDVNQLIDPTSTKCNSGKMLLTVVNKRIKVSCI